MPTFALFDNPTSDRRKAPARQRTRFAPIGTRFREKGTRFQAKGTQSGHQKDTLFQPGTSDQNPQPTTLSPFTICPPGRQSLFSPPLQTSSRTLTRQS